MALPFSQVPSGAKVPPSPFQVHVPDEQIEELQLLIKLSKIAPPTFESQQQDRKYGITTEWLTVAREAWKTFDWYFSMLSLLFPAWGSILTGTGEPWKTTSMASPSSNTPLTD